MNQTAPESPEATGIRRARRAGQLVGGFLLGLALLPAVFELWSLVGDISPFRYQGF